MDSIIGGLRRPQRPSVAFIAWAQVAGRSEEIAGALGGEARCFFDLALVWRPLIPIRYAISTVRTVAYLVRRRPKSVIASNPPIFPGLIAWAYCRVTGGTFLLDSHPDAFASGDAALPRLFMPLHRFLARRAASTLVTTDALAQRVREWGGSADIVHEAPPKWTTSPPRPLDGDPQILLVSLFHPDEPITEAVAAARLLPEVQLRITGDIRKCPSAVKESAPSTVEFTGFLDEETYPHALKAADIVMSLTRWPEAASRAAHEAVYAQRPLVVSDWAAARDLFPYAIHVTNSPAGIAAGLRLAMQRHRELRGDAAAADRLQRGRWESQLETLSRRIGKNCG